MTWTLTKVERKPWTPQPGQSRDPEIGLLLQAVTMEFIEIDSNGGPTGKTRSYTEPNVSDVTDEGIAKLARSQMRQLEKISAVATGQVSDLSNIRALVSPAPVAQPIATATDVQRDAIVVLLRTRVSHLRTIELGLASATDADVVDTKKALDDAMTADRALVLSLIG